MKSDDYVFLDYEGRLLFSKKDHWDQTHRVGGADKDDLISKKTI